MPEMQHKWSLAQVRAGQVRHPILRPKPLSLLAHILDQLRPHNPFGETGEILYQRGQGELPARLVAFND
jgi:hypothetical protein